ncbi:hypothetical protein AJ79_00186 [Helicocarpus griseus UAMH5409]|uniref:Uncharacterized protein n=1 Tax=Helicocarpus griseus UAMH5409 TaxID=1447875 RepID=A0A2B7YCL1_9EURO|nr:hypothetical protein AJ79_00186 [Helicocarpus griseus UAMH5409]
MSANAAPQWRRTRIGSTLTSDSSLRRRQTVPFDTAAAPKVVQERYPAYDDFPWIQIRDYLQMKWPSWTQFNEARVGDSWQFEVPENLSKAKTPPS